MSQHLRADLQEPGEVTVTRLLDPPDVGRAPPVPQRPIATTVKPPGQRSRLGTVIALSGIGLLLQGIGDAVARHGHQSPAVALFLCGIALEFGGCAWRLLSAETTRRERVLVSVVLGLGLFASYVMLEPLLLDTFDELDHVGTLARILDSHALFPTNTVLPISPYYPGLELATAATKWITGLPIVIDQLVVLSVIRIVLVLGVFLVVERATHSSRAGGIGVLVYAASPQFYGFDAQYAYETIALAFAVGAVYFLFFSVDAARPRMGRAFVLALGSVAAVVISHHVTGWLTIGFLVAWTAGLFLVARPVRLPLVSRWRLFRWRPSFWPAPDISTQALSASHSEELRERRRAQARIVGVATAVGVAIGAAWTVFVFHLLTPYLGPIFSDAYTEVREALGNGHGDRTLFKSSSGGASPHWEVGLILLSALCWCLVLLPALYSVVFKRSVRGGALRYIPAVIAALYPLSVLANVTSGSKLVAERATTFIFFGVAVVIGAWLATRIARERGVIERLGTIAVATVVFLGSLLFGIGPLVSLLPGPYVVGGDNLSYGSPSLAVAHWADTHLPAGSNVAADKDNGVLLNAIGGVDSVTAEGGLVNPELLYFDRSLSIYDIYLIRKADIRYLVVDDRLAQGLPLYGTYIAEGEPPERLGLPQLTKFDSYPFIKRIYDNGPIQVFDLTQLLPSSARAAPAGPVAGGSGLNVGVFVLAVLAGGLWLLRLRRRRSARDLPHLVLCGLVAALVIGVFGAFLVRLLHLPPEAVAVVVLIVLLALSLRPPSWRLPGRIASHPGVDRPSGPSGPVPVGSTFSERREVRDVLAYLRALADPDDDAALRRIVNVPKRGIGPKTVSRLADWARANRLTFAEAVDRADDAGLRGHSLEGARELSALLAELRPLARTTPPADFVELVMERTGYRAGLTAEHSAEAQGRLENLAELAAWAGAFADLPEFLEAAALEASGGPGHRGTAAPRPATSSPSAPRRPRRSRAQVILGCAGVALFAAGATVASLAALKDWTPPPELSIATSTTNRSVADVQLGSAGPVPARLEVTNGGRTLWGSSLARSAGPQQVAVPARFLHKGSRVVVVTDGHVLRWVDGWVETVPKVGRKSVRL